MNEKIMRKILGVALKLAAALLIVASNSALAQRGGCIGGSVGPMTVTHNPPLPSVFNITKRSVGDVMWTGSIVVRFNGCKVGPWTNNYSIWMAAATGGADGADLLNSAGNPSGLFIRQQSTAATVVSIGSCSNTGPGSTQNRTQLGFCKFDGMIGVDWGAVRVTFPGIVISVKNPNASSSTLSNTRVTQGAGVPNPWVMTNSSQFGVFTASTDNVAVSAPASSVVRAACTLSPTNTTVTLPNVSTAALNSAGATAGLTPFNMNLTGCTNGGSTFDVDATWSFTQGTSASSIANSAAGAAQNVETQILKSDYSPISTGTVIYMGAVPASGGTLDSTFFARYVATGVASAGAVRGVATFTLSYR